MHETVISRTLLSGLIAGAVAAREVQLTPRADWSEAALAEVAHCWQLIEDQVVRLIRFAGPDTLEHQVGSLVTLDSSKINEALHEAGAIPAPFFVTRANIDLLLLQGPESFLRAMSCGLRNPDHHELSYHLHDKLFDRANAGATAAEWRAVWRAWCDGCATRAGAGKEDFVGYQLLRLVRDKRPEFAPGMPELISELLARQVRDRPKAASKLLRDAIIGNHPDFIIALLLFGTAIPDDISRIQKSNLTAKLLCKLKNNHDRLSFMAPFGPLERVFDPGSPSLISHLAPLLASADA